jgi:NAD(P)-dependent dehydrogenase (short-subunit alcohol dehydrogenase family)
MQRVIWVTGSTGNLGKAVCHRFIRSGDKVIGTVMPGELPETGLSAEGISFHPLDLLDEAAVRADVASTVSETGRIDVAVLTAGGFTMGDIRKTGLEDIRRQIQLNFDTAYTAARPIFLQMLEQGQGRIFMVGSRPGLDMRDGKGMTAYSLSKSLVFRLAELMNREAAGTGVVVSVLVPSIIDTPQNRVSMPNADFSAWVSPDAIAETIHYHSSPEAAHLREPVLKVYGRS